MTYRSLKSHLVVCEAALELTCFSKLKNGILVLLLPPFLAFSAKEWGIGESASVRCCNSLASQEPAQEGSTTGWRGRRVWIWRHHAFCHVNSKRQQATGEALCTRELFLPFSILISFIIFVILYTSLTAALGSVAQWHYYICYGKVLPSCHHLLLKLVCFWRADRNASCGSHMS